MQNSERLWWWWGVKTWVGGGPGEMEEEEEKLEIWMWWWVGPVKGGGEWCSRKQAERRTVRDDVIGVASSDWLLSTWWMQSRCSLPHWTCAKLLIDQWIDWLQSPEAQRGDFMWLHVWKYKNRHNSAKFPQSGPCKKEKLHWLSMHLHAWKVTHTQTCPWSYVNTHTHTHTHIYLEIQTQNDHNFAA